MGLFNFFKNSVKAIDFSYGNVQALSTLTDELSNTLAKEGYVSAVDHLAKIRKAAHQYNADEFRSLVISAELFGGSGAIWEIEFEDDDLQDKFNIQFYDYVELLIAMGIENRRVKQVRRKFKNIGNI